MAASPEGYAFEQLDPPRFPLAKQFYKQSNYHSHVGKEDEVYVYRDISQGNKIIAAVRLVRHDSFLILRSMVVSPSYQRQGIGQHFLTALGPMIGGRECWCFPFEWLESFYAQIDFIPVVVDLSPPSIADKFKRYIRQGRKLIIMQRSSSRP